MSEEARALLARLLEQQGRRQPPCGDRRAAGLHPVQMAAPSDDPLAPIRELRLATGASFAACTHAWLDSGGLMARATDLLRQRGQ
jgi:hypothetical protein